MTIIPVASIAGGGGGGGSDGNAGSGAGFGMGARPLGIYLLKDGHVQWRPAVDANRLILGGQVLALVMMLTLRAIMKAQARTTAKT